jgi:hypothetical protein
VFQLDYRSHHATWLQRQLGRARSTQHAVDLMQDIGEALIDQNRKDRLRSRDVDGNRLIPWRVRKGPYKDASGPTLAPFGDNSRSIAWFGYDVKQAGTRLGQTFTLSAGWEDRGEHPRGPKGKPGTIIFQYHARGIAAKLRTKAGKIRKRGAGMGTVVRDILGVTPTMKERVSKVWRRHVDGWWSRA